MRLTVRYIVLTLFAIFVVLSVVELFIHFDSTMGIYKTVRLKVQGNLPISNPQSGLDYMHQWSAKWKLGVGKKISVGNKTLKSPGPDVPWESSWISADMYRSDPNALTGNDLIDNYGHNDMNVAGENGKAVKLKTNPRIQTHMADFHVNVLASDVIPLNRKLHDSRPRRCAKVSYPKDLPTASIVVPFYNEWPSILLRTVYSVINRTPRHLLREIVLVDDGSDMDSLKEPLDKYMNSSFPRGLVKLIHLPKRIGLIRARLIGWKETTSDVIIFFDCHMEVNIDWIQPLLHEIKKDRKTVAMGILDYINAETFEYKYYEEYFTRYGFDWRLTFFETFWRRDQVKEGLDINPRIGAVMVGAGFAIDSTYFAEIGTYDEGMDVWGGENLELAWRVWMCGGRLIHLPCSHIGHIARSQPYSFPGGRRNVEIHNYKRAVDVWMGEYKTFVYDHFPEMEKMDTGDLSKRFELKERLQCKNFTWFIDNIWPEMNLFNRFAKAWGSVENPGTGYCLDTNNFLFNYAEPLKSSPCTHKLANQGFTWDKSNRIRSSLHCMVTQENEPGVKLDDCIQAPTDLWKHKKNGPITNVRTGLCLEIDEQYNIETKACDPKSPNQQWTFRHYTR